MAVCLARANGHDVTLSVSSLGTIYPSNARDVDESGVCFDTLSNWFDKNMPYSDEFAKYTSIYGNEIVSLMSSMAEKD